MTLITSSIEKCIQESVLCWLATSSDTGHPNVSPKEIFALHEEQELIIANIASPQSSKNLKVNGWASVAVLDIWKQKGYQLNGRARVISKEDKGYQHRAHSLEQMTKGLFPFREIFSLNIERVKPILAPSYILFPETTEDRQIENALRAYGVEKRRN